MRTGLVTKKLGMSTFFDEKGVGIPVTLLKVDDCQVVGHRSEEKDGVLALRVGHGKAKPNKVKKSQKGYFSKNKLEFKRHIVDFRVSKDAVLEIGANINADHYVVGQFIDVIGTSVGKGFAGAMKRHGFSGLRASHGVSISHRSHGSTGQNQDPGKVQKGKKMAGHMGARRVTVGNLEIIEIDRENNVLVVKGAIPGSENSRVLVIDAHKKGLPVNVPYPGVISAQKESPAEVKETVQEASQDRASESTVDNGVTEQPEKE
jgi:large subunit ribosomal protein L3